MHVMGRVVCKAAAVFALVLLPLGLTFWHRSHAVPRQYRCDLTLYKSLWVWMHDGYCTLHLLSLPTKVASRTEHRATLTYDPRPRKRAFLVQTERIGPFHHLWIVFPMAVLPAGLALLGVLPLAYEPARSWWRRRAGRCAHCGYSLMGNRSGLCPECGAPALTRRSPHPRPRNPALSRRF